MVWGIWANAVTTGLAAIAYSAAAGSSYARQRRRALPLGAAPLLFATIALYLALAAARQVAAALSVNDPSYVDVDRGIYYAVVIPAALVIVPHMHLVSFVHWGDVRRSRLVAAMFLAVVAIGIAFGYLGGVEGPVASDFGTDWSLRSPVTKVLLVAAIMLPGIAGSGLLLVTARRLGERDRRRVARTGWATLAYFLVFTLDAFGLSGIPLLLARLLTAATGVLAWSAYREPPGFVYVPPPSKPGDRIYEQ